MPAPSPENWKPKLPLKFPRQFRPQWQIRYPNFREDGDLTSKLYWAGREASNRWKEAMDEPSRNLSATTVTPTDFIVAVFDKAAEMNELVQDQLFWQDSYIPSPEKWQRYTKKLITIARRQALKQIRAQFPNASQNDIDNRTASLESVMKFASGAMDCMWSARDSDGGRIEIRPFNSGIIKRYLPDRTKLSPRPFTRIDPDGTEVVMWLDYDYNVVPAPRGLVV